MKSPAIVLHIVWAAVLSGLLVFSAFVLVVGSASQGRTPALGSESAVIQSLNAITIVTAIAAWFLPRWLWGRIRKFQPDVATLSDAELCKLYMTPMVVRLALFEAVSIFGIIVSTALADAAAFVPYLFISFVGLLVSIPTMGRIKSTLSI